MKHPWYPTASIGFLFILSAPLLFSQAKLNPPPGIPVPSEIKLSLETEAAELWEDIETLQSLWQQDPVKLELIYDVIIYYNAVHYALELDQFYSDKKTDEFEIAFRHLATGRQRTTALKEGNAPWTKQHGLVVRGYRSEIDGSIQPYGLVIPASYDFDSDTPSRLDIWYHGRGDTLSELKFIDQRETDIGKLVTDQAIVLHPYGRYCNANKFAGEVDTFEALAQLKKHYRIDDDRINVRGFSMGGAATWHMATHHAGLWSAAAPGAGFAESAIYAAVMTKEPKPTWYELKLHSLYDATKYAANLHQCPTVAYSGSEDKQKQAADIMAEYLRSEGINLLHIIGKGMGHKYDDPSLERINQTVDEWSADPKNRFPATINFVTYTLRYNTMHWLTVDGLKEHWKEARVRANIQSTDRISITTKNVSEFTLNFPKGHHSILTTEAIEVLIDQTKFQIEGGRNDGSRKPSFVSTNGVWQIKAPKEKRVLVKSHGLQGPIDDAFMSRFIFVLPSEKEASPNLSAWVDNESADAQLQWWRQFRGKPNVKYDNEVTEEDIENAHLILWGDPASNRIIKRIQESLPFQWEGSLFTINDKRYTSDAHVPALIYPNPLNPQKYIVLNSGFTFSEFSGGTNSLQIPKLPDWSVIDLGIPRHLRHPAGVTDAGFFNELWAFKNL
jgi:predicted esterase